ncbi:helix-turn-helix domain-containing protein, partial [Enterococcus hirae]
MEFGKLLKQERKKMNLTQADLAEQLNVSRSAIS